MSRHLALLLVFATDAAAQCPEWDLTFANPGANTYVWAVAAHDEGAGAPPRLFVAGDFTQVGGIAANRIARWDGTSWSALGSGLDGRVHALATYDDGTGPALYAGGSFTHAGGVVAPRVARWNGNTWSAVGGLGPGDVRALTVYDDGLGLGPALFAGEMRWTAATGWVSTGSIGSIDDFAAYDDGGGRKLYACGLLNATSAGASRFVARWDGIQWTSLPAGGPEFVYIDDYAYAVCAFDDGSGPALYVGGSFGGAFTHMARFDGAAWSTVGGGLPGYGDYSDVQDLAVHDDGTGPALYATGQFQGAAQSTSGFARWNGQTWRPLASGPGLPAGSGMALVSHDDGSGPAVFFGGWIGILGGPTTELAKWHGPLQPLDLSLTPPVNSLTAVVGDHVTLTANAQGAGPFQYRWRKGITYLTDGGPITGALTSTLSLQVVSPEFSAGFYTCEVSNACVTRSVGLTLFVQSGPGTPVCSGSTAPTPCPCGNASVLGDTQGCLNSTGLGGWLAATGTASVTADALILRGANMTNSSALYFQGTDSVNGGNGAAFGDGLRCAGGTTVRLGRRTNVSGESSWPGATDPPLSSGLTAGATRTYQAWYRDAAAFCTPATHNLTNGVRVTWQP